MLLVTGQKSVFNGTTRALHQAILKTCSDKAKIEFIEIAGVANVLEEKVNFLFLIIINLYIIYSSFIIDILKVGHFSAKISQIPESVLSFFHPALKTQLLLEMQN